MSSTDEQRSEEQDSEDLELDTDQSEGVQGGVAPADPAKAPMPDPPAVSKHSPLKRV
jgi:hypothetical protein